VESGGPSAPGRRKIRGPPAELTPYSLSRCRCGALAKAYTDFNARQQQLVRGNAKRGLFGSAVSGLVTGGGFVVILVFYDAGQLTLPGAAAAGFAYQQIRAWTQQFTGSISALFQAAIFLESFESFRQADKQFADRSGSETVPGPFGRMELSHVGLRYPDAERFAVEDVNITITAGEVLAIVGRNGSGKTTLAKLICTAVSAGPRDDRVGRARHV